MSFIKIALFSCFSTFAVTLKIGDMAPLFVLKNQEGINIDLTRQKGWTVLYFFPKAETPGCSKQAENYRDNAKELTHLGIEIFGISINTVEEQKAFFKNHQLNFTLLADEKGEVTEKYGSKMPFFNMSKRWTYIIDPHLIIRDISQDVDPSSDASRVIEVIKKLSTKK